MLVLTLTEREVIVLHTLEGKVVIRLPDGEKRIKLGIDAPRSVEIGREPVDNHPIHKT